MLLHVDDFRPAHNLSPSLKMNKALAQKPLAEKRNQIRTLARRKFHALESRVTHSRTGRRLAPRRTAGGACDGRRHLGFVPATRLAAKWRSSSLMGRSSARFPAAVSKAPSSPRHRVCSPMANRDTLTMGSPMERSLGGWSAPAGAAWKVFVERDRRMKRNTDPRPCCSNPRACQGTGGARYKSR